MGAAALVGVLPSAHAQDPLAPSWADVPALRTLVLNWDAGLSPQDNGELLEEAVEVLQPGDRLQVSAGVWSVEAFWNLDLTGTAQAPIRIVGAPGAVLTRSNAWQNVLNLGSPPARVRYLSIEGFEITGGSYGLRMWDCGQVWLRGLHIHHVADVAISANSFDTSHLFITDCHVHHTAQAAGAKGEAIYLGANFGQHITRNSVVARCHVHDTGGTDGDGIELKEGSFDCRIVDNVVHDTVNPAVLVYGTGGLPRNRIERNQLWGTSGGLTLQVQGDALVRDNLVLSEGDAFESHNHQGTVQELELVHNTFVAYGNAARLNHWQNKPGMVCADNAFYSQAGEAIRFAGGSAGIFIQGNVTYGPVVGSSSGWSPGTGLSDFHALDPSGSSRQPQPRYGSPLQGAATGTWASDRDVFGLARPLAPSVGASEPGSFGQALGSGVAGYQGRTPRLITTEPPVAGLPVHLRLEEAAPQVEAFLFVGFGSDPTPFHSGHLWPAQARVTRTTTNSSGRGGVWLQLPPQLAGLEFVGQWATFDPAAPGGVALGQGVSFGTL